MYIGSYNVDLLELHTDYKNETRFKSDFDLFNRFVSFFKVKILILLFCYYDYVV